MNRGTPHLFRLSRELFGGKTLLEFSNWTSHRLPADAADERRSRGSSSLITR